MVGFMGVFSMISRGAQKNRQVCPAAFSFFEKKRPSE